MEDGLLSGYRVLDLADEQGVLCGRILGDLGAEIIAVEPPGGNPCRRIGPFYKDTPHPEKSLFWFAYAMNKKSITLDLDREDGRALLRELATRSDILVESFGPGYMQERGLGYEELSRLNPRLIVVSITPFGEQAPYRDHKGADLVHWAMGGIQYMSGDPELPPVRISVPQSYLHAGAQAASGTMAALFHREVTGEGQQITLAVQDCIPITTMEAPAYWDLLQFDVQRTGTQRKRLFPGGLLTVRSVFPCRDGHVVNYIFGGLLGEAANRRWSEWMESEGVNLDHLAESGWPAFDMGKVTPEQMTAICDTLGEFIAKFTKDELYRGVFERDADIMLVPVSSPKDLWDDKQLKARDYFVEIDHDELGATLAYPGAWVSVQDGPAMGNWKRAPLIGEHNEAIYTGELGRSKEGLARLKQSGAI